AAPLPLRKTDLVPGGLRDSLQRDRRLGQDAVDHARREDRERLAVAMPAFGCPVPIRHAGQVRRPGYKPAEWSTRTQQAVGELRALPDSEHRLLPERLPALAPMLEDLAGERNVDWTDLLTGVALRAQRVGQISLVQTVVKRRQHELDRTVVEVSELVAAHGHERGTCVGAGAAPNAGEGVGEHVIRAQLLGAVVEDHAVHLPRSVNADRE